MSNRDLLNLLVGADAAMYVNITKYGSTYPVIDSMVVGTASAKLLDLKIGAVLWAGSASASNNEGGNNSGGGLIGALMAAAVKQIINSTTDQSHPVAGVAGARLLSRPARPTACCMARARKNTALCRSVWNLTSGVMPCDAIVQRHGGTQRIGRQVFKFGHP
jgi:hypothetical protein